jgi:simple sugar transport system ATP-binding protein
VAAQSRRRRVIGIRDLDEILELADRVAVMSGGTIDYGAPIEQTDRTTIGKHMAGTSA